MNERTRRGLALVLLLAAAGCGTGDEPDEGPGQQQPEPEPEPEPGEKPALTAAALLVRMEAPGTADLVLGTAGAAADAERVIVYADAKLEEELVRTPVAADGSFGPVSFGDNAHARIWLVAENEHGLSAAAALENDVEGPILSLQEKPADPSASADARFELACSEADCTFACSLDGAAMAPCAATIDYGDLAEGAHGFVAIATDAAGNESAPIAWDWNVDLTDPVVTITGKPADRSSDPAPVFTFECSREGCTFECAYDGEAFAPCTSPRTQSVTSGEHSFAVRGLAGLSVGEPTSYQWLVDLAGPVVSFDQQPPAHTNEDEAHLAFSCDEACTFLCNVDGAGFAACESPQTLTGLSEGVHLFEVRATDAAGNESERFVRWTVDFTPPTAAFTALPAPNRAAATFEFGCNVGGPCTFTCALDGEEPSPCASPAVRNGLAEGPHGFTAVPTDAAGNEGAAIHHAWTIDTVAPVVSMPDAPTGTTGNYQVTITLVCDEPNCTFECQVNGGILLPCTSPHTMSLSPGPYTLRLVGTDAAGNTGEATAGWTMGAVEM
ncbi:hypothetical protein [Vulgatibacter sp.]|uniref:hypothetical protein n=1 Tax=Vulgatibacter sp. TaxID=1971226 RepID=UPI0035664600